MSIAHNIEVIRDKVYSAARRAGRDSLGIIIACVTKNRIVDEIYQALDAGIEHIAESKVQEAQEKHAALRDYAEEINIPISIHMIGYLQTNKVNKALDIFNMIQSVDSFKLAQKIDDAARERGVSMEILVEVNASEEESKFGVSSELAVNLLKEISVLDNVCVRGLMTMAPLLAEQEYARPYFQKLRELRDKVNEINEPLFREKIKMDFLSMGMSHDYEVAVEEGANMVRIGTAIFDGTL